MVNELLEERRKEKSSGSDNRSLAFGALRDFAGLLSTCCSSFLQRGVSLCSSLGLPFPVFHSPEAQEMTSAQPSAREIKFAKALVNPDKQVRDETFATLKGFLSNSKAHVDEMLQKKQGLKLWKALYYSLWLADKYPVQLELAQGLVDMLDHMPNLEAQATYISSCYAIVLREWSLLDKYRVNKFYSLLRLMLRKVFTLAAASGWESRTVSSLVGVVQREVLSVLPNGPRLHYADIFLPELYQVTQGKMTGQQLLAALQPFLATLLSHDDAIYRQRVQKSIFRAYLDTFAAENEEDTVFKTVRTIELQKRLFDMASDPNTLDELRSQLYALHKAFASKTGKAFVEEEDLIEKIPTEAVVAPTPAKGQRRKAAPTAQAPSLPETPSHEGMKTRSSQRRKRASTAPAEEEEEAAPVATPVVEERSSKRRTRK